MDDAIDRGVDWLRRAQRPNGSFAMDGDDGDGKWPGGPWAVGANALAVYTLAACEVPLDDPVMVKGFARIREDWSTRKEPPKDLHEARVENLAGRGDGRTTYFVSLCLMALDAAHNRGAAPMGKGPPGGRRPASLSKEDRAWAAEMVAWLARTQDDGEVQEIPSVPPGGRKRKPRPRPVATGDRPSVDEGGGWGYGNVLYLRAGYHDHSNSQFALLGLKAAARLGADVPRETWIRGLRHFLAAQEPKGPEVPRVDAPGAADPGKRPRTGEVVTVGATREKDEARGWGYLCGSADLAGIGDPSGVSRRAYANMTAGGVSSLIIARSELDGGQGFGPGLRALSEKGIRDGLAWLAHHWGEIDGSFRGQAGLPIVGSGALDDFYLLYGVERACILGGVSLIGSADWYAIGARALLPCQGPEGEFRSRLCPYGALVDSCFALLFLKRAVFRVPSRAVATESGANSLDLSGAKDLDDASFRAVLESVLRRFMAAGAEDRHARAAEFVQMGVRVIPLLILRLDDAEEGVRAAAIEVLLRTTGASQGYDPKRPEEARSAAIRAWEDWWMARGKILVADVDAGRFRE